MYQRRLPCRPSGCATGHPSPVTERAQAEEAIKDFEDLDLAQSVIRDRIAYRKAARDGLCVAELRPADPKAVEEARALFAEVFAQ